MAIPTRIKTKRLGDTTEIQCLVNHPMETGRRLSGKTRDHIPANFVQKVVFKINGQQIAEADIGASVSKDPLFAVRIKGAKFGDSVEVKWTDNIGEKGRASTTIT